MLATYTKKKEIILWDRASKKKIIHRQYMQDVQDLATSETQCALLKKDGRVLLYSQELKTWRRLPGTYEGAIRIDVSNHAVLLTFADGKLKWKSISKYS